MATSILHVLYSGLADLLMSEIAVTGIVIDRAAQIAFGLITFEKE